MTLTGKKPDADFIFATLDTIGLAKDANRVVRLFSRGMQQRVAIGRLLVLQSNVWILDEPTTGLDEAGRRWLLDLLKAQTAAGKLILMSSHHQGEVSAVASRILCWIQEGCVSMVLQGHKGRQLPSRSWMKGRHDGASVFSHLGQRPPG